MKNKIENLNNIGKAWRKIRDDFAKNNIDSASLDARLLAQFAFKKDELEFAVKEHDLVSVEQMIYLEKLAKRRMNGEPVARILGTKEFYGLEFKLNKNTLVPRPETELLVDICLEQIGQNQNLKLLELGVGSGCIIISILANNDNVIGLGTDISQQALEIAKTNARFHNVLERIRFLRGNWFERLNTNKKFDIIISNPPYIETKEIATLAKDVKDFDPVLALDGGEDGLEPYRIIARNAKNYLNDNGFVIVEFGVGQEGEIIEMFLGEGFTLFEKKPDLSGIIRALVFQNFKHFTD